MQEELDNNDHGKLIRIEEDIVLTIKEINRKSAASTQKPVEQLDLLTGEVVHRYSSASEAGTLMCADQSTLSTVCLGKGKSAYNFKWRFYTGPLLGKFRCKLFQDYS
jgi:hypothetical protein